MPPAAPIITIALINAGVSAGFAIAAGTVLSSIGTALILGGISMALAPKPKGVGAGTVSSGTVALKQPDLLRSYCYGHTRAVRGFANMESTGANGVLHLIVILCEGELRAINEVWLNDYCIPNDWIDADGNVTQGRYAGFLTIRKHLGSSTQAADPVAVANMADWTSEHRLQGIAYLYITMTKNQDVYPVGLPSISAIVEGKTVYDPRIDGQRWTTNAALYAYDFLVNNDYGYSIQQDDINLLNVAAQANICDEIVDTIEESFEVKNTENNRFTFDGDLLAWQFGDRVRVTTTGTLPTGIAADTDYYVIPYQIKDTPRIYLATSLDNSMDKTFITFSGGSGTMTITKTGEPRYHGSGTFESDEELSTTLNDIVSSMAGRAINSGGYWTLLAGAWRSPSVELGINDFRSGGIGLRNNLSMSESFNIIKGLFVSSLNAYQASDYPSVKYPQFILDDNGVEAVRDLNLRFTNRPTTAQRIAKIELFKGRQGIATTANFSLKAMQLAPGDTVYLNVDRVGWEQKPFEVTNFSFIVQDNAIFVNLNLRETAQQIFDWSQGEAIDYDPAPNTNLTNPFQVAIPSGVKYNSRSVISANGDETFIVQMQWNLHPDAFVREYGDLELQYKLSSSPTWLPSFFVSGHQTQTDMFPASAGERYDVRIRAVNNVGVRSSWVAIFEIVVGSSGGVDDTEDWGFASDAPDEFEDWGFASDAPDEFEDWGFAN